MIDPYKFIKILTSKLSENAIVVCANGTACVAMFQTGIVKKGQRIFWNSGCAAMGYALPAAIGACFASGREVICIEGDGSIMMNIQELQTVKHHNLPIKLFILNNQGYHSLQEAQDNYFNSQYIGCTDKDISFPNFQKLADLFDMPYSYISEMDTLDNALEIIINMASSQRLIEVILGEYKFRKEIL